MPSMMEISEKLSGKTEVKATPEATPKATEPKVEVEETESVEASGVESSETEQGQSQEQEVTHKYEPPSSWTKEQKEEFFSYDEKIQERISNAYKSMQGDYTKKTQELAEERKALETLKQTGDYITAHPELQTAFMEMMKSHFESKQSGKPWEWGKEKKVAEPSDMEKMLKQAEEWEGMDDAALEETFVSNPSATIKTLTKLLRGVALEINNFKGEFSAKLEPLNQRQRADAEIASLLKTLPKEQYNPEFIGKLDKMIDAGDPSWEGKTLGEVFPLAVEKLTGIVNSEKAKEEGKAEGEAKAKLEADKRKMAGPGKATATTPKTKPGVAAGMTQRFEGGGLSGISKNLGG